MKKLIFWIAALLIIGCNPLKKAQDQFKLHPDQFAELTAKYYPCQDTSYVIDSVSYDTLYKPSEPLTTIEYKSDTVFKTITVPGTTRFVTKYFTRDSIVIRRDNAQETALKNIIAQRDKTVADTTAEYASLKDGRHWWKTACLITWGILLAMIIGWVIAKFYGK